jgi:transglutaminase-like putative cysteine protease
MHFHKGFLLGAILLASTAPHVAFGQFQAPTKEELAMTSDPQAPGAPAVYLYREERTDEPHHFRSVYARIKVLTEAGKEAATVHVVYHKNFMFYATGDNSSRMANGFSTSWNAPDISHAGEDARIDTNATGGHADVSTIEGRVIHTDGTVIPLTGTPADLLKVKNGNDQFNQMTFTLPDVQVGSIIEYRYQVRYDRFLSAPQWQIQQPYFVHKAHYVFVPAEQFAPNRSLGGSSGGVSDASILGAHGEVETDIRSVNVLPPGKELKQDGLGNWFIDFTDIPAIPLEPFSPPLAAQIYQVDFFYTFTPDAKEFWQKEMSIWAKDVNDYTAPTGLIKSTADELTAGLTTPLDKAKKLYALVEKFDNHDFSGNAPPFAATDFVPRVSVDGVLEHKGGNSEELALLYLSLARAAGLDARPERIASRNRRTFSAQLQDTSQLDSVVIGLNIDGKEIVVDPGQKMAPFQTLHWSHAGAGGVAMAANGKVEIIVTPLQDNKDNTMVRVGTLTVSPQGTVSGTLKVGFIGQEALFLRQMAIRTDADTVKQQMEGMIAAEVPNGIEAHIDHIANLDDPDKQLVAVIPVTGSLADHAGGHLVLPRLFFETKETDPFPADPNRMLPVDMHYPAQEQEQITYNLPPGFALEGTLQDASLKWEEIAAYQLRSKADAGSITTARILARGFTLLEPTEYGKLRDFYDKVATTDRQQLVLTAAQTSSK